MVIVGTEGIEDIPDDLVVVLRQGFFGGFALGDNHWDEDVAVLLLLGLTTAEATHHTADTLHHIDLTGARAEEEDGIKCWHIDPFAEAAHIGQHTAFLGVGSLFAEPAEGISTLGSPHRAIDVARLDTHRTLLLLGGEALGEVLGE